MQRHRFPGTNSPGVTRFRNNTRTASGMIPRECIFEQRGPSVCVCLICGVKMHSDDPGKCHSVCSAVSVACRHIGPSSKAIRIQCTDGKIARAMTNKCEIHNRCLLNYAPTGNRLLDWVKKPESKLYHLCHNCKDFITGVK